MYQKKCPEYKIASKLDICKITDTNSNQRLIKDIRCASQSTLFSYAYAQICKQGGSKCLIFKWLAHKNFKRKIICFNLRCQQTWNVVIDL